MKKSISWKKLLVVGLIFWLVGNFIFTDMIGGGFKLIGSICLLLGIVILIDCIFIQKRYKRNKKSVAQISPPIVFIKN